MSRVAASRQSPSFSKGMRPNHLRVSRMIGFTLTIGTPKAWAGFTIVAAARLAETERAALAFAALSSLAPEHSIATAAAAIRPAGAPLPAFLGGMDDAREWAFFARRPELKAYATAAFEAMEAPDQADFFRHSREVAI
ncbi:MAG TPA: hypothetical protein PKA33_08585 [Amaricoccus sp.]|uniref:hypothetical protein n=1 Tax=Amaricoccus sp. TaxID=1872485 RepID=UPI002BA9E1BB|nr:hypothetical protein [Amaricoccus sp.]HMQ94812.1 hypothetical protein [Amaricoccus sp.]HMR52436.1 hypothetical protein [Amaricoccus sp.]HMT99408.1 hypothetical protein [Amaricoccus sp.]